MLKGMKKHEDKEQGKTIKHEAPRSISKLSLCPIAKTQNDYDETKKNTLG